MTPGLAKANVRLIGPPRVETDQLTTDHFRSGRVVALLAYLCLRPNQDVPREELAERLWPKLGPEAARNNLRVTLQYLKQLLAAHGLEAGLRTSDRTRIGIDGSIIVSDFSLLHSDREDNLFSGTFLTGITDDWAETARAEYIGRRVEQLCQTARVHLATDPSQALELATAAVGGDPFNAEARWLSAKANLMLGKPEAALKELEEYAQALLSEERPEMEPPLRDLLAEARVMVKPITYGLSNRLPARRTKFYGREREVSFLLAWIDEGKDPVMTVYGPGGIGKSRLGAEVANLIPAASDLSLLWTDATHALTRESLLDLIASELSSGEAVHGDPFRYITASLHGARILFVLDNLEQIPDEDLQIVDELLGRLPRAQALCLSRKTLGVPGERTLRLDPLPLPEGPEDLDSPAVALFLDRATVQGETLPSADELHELVTALEGIPLAIELAAAKTLSFDIGELLEGMTARLDLLVGRNSTIARHRTMRSTLDWSFDLLEPEVREAITALALLKNGWSLEAADALLREGASDIAATRELVEIGCANSLLARQSGRQGSRYQMLECTREYALESMAPSRKSEFRTRHAEYFAALASKGSSHMVLEEALPNLEAAFEYFAECPERIERLLAMGESLIPFWTNTNAGRSALRTLQSIPLESLSESQQGRLLLLSARIQLAIADYSGGEQSCDSAVERLAETGDPVLLAQLMTVLSRTLSAMGRGKEADEAARHAVELATNAPPIVQAEALHALAKRQIAYQGDAGAPTIEKAVAKARETEEPLLVADVLDTLGCLYLRDRQFSEAEEVFDQIAALPFSPGALRQALLSIRRAQIALAQSDFEAAKGWYEDALLHARRANHPWWIGQILEQLADTYTALGFYVLAHQTHMDSLTLRRRAKESWGTLRCLRGLSVASLKLGESVRAFEEISRALDLSQEIGDEFLRATLLLPYARAALAVGELEAATEVLQEAQCLCQTLLQDARYSHEMDLSAALSEADELLTRLNH